MQIQNRRVKKNHAGLYMKGKKRSLRQKWRCEAALLLLTVTDTQTFKSAQQSFDLVNPDSCALCRASASNLKDIIRCGAL